MLYQLYRHEIKTVQIIFYFNILFKSHPPISPPTTYLFQPGLTHVIHSLFGWIYAHPSYKTVKQFTQTTQTLPEKHSLISYVHPVGFSPCSTYKLDIPGLQSDSPCMNGQQVGILHQAHHVVFCSFMESLKSTPGPLHWALDNRTTCIFGV